MSPGMNEGDLIIYKPFILKKDVLHKGSLVVANHPLRESTLIVKRVSKVREFEVELLGDNQLTSIDSRHFGPVNKNQIKGIVEKIVQNSK